MEVYRVPASACINEKDGSSMEFDFENMNAFAADDMYGVGGGGGVWRFAALK